MMAIQGFMSPVSEKGITIQLLRELQARGLAPDLYAVAGWRWSQGKLEKAIKAFVEDAAESGAEYKLIMVGHSRGAGHPDEIPDSGRVVGPKAIVPRENKDVGNDI